MATVLRLSRPEQALPGRGAAMLLPAEHFVNGNPIAPPFPAGLEEAVFGMGCFWGAERKFWQAPDVYTTAVGYAGVTPNPTYREVCLGEPPPTQGMRQGNDVGTQYRSAIFTTSEEQGARRIPTATAGWAAPACRARRASRPSRNGLKTLMNTTDGGSI